MFSPWVAALALAVLVRAGRDVFDGDSEPGVMQGSFAQVRTHEAVKAPWPGRAIPEYIRGVKFEPSEYNVQQYVLEVPDDDVRKAQNLLQSDDPSVADEACYQLGACLVKSNEHQGKWVLLYQSETHPTSKEALDALGLLKPPPSETTEEKESAMPPPDVTRDAPEEKEVDVPPLGVNKSSLPPVEAPVEKPLAVMDAAPQEQEAELRPAEEMEDRLPQGMTSDVQDENKMEPSDVNDQASDENEIETSDVQKDVADVEPGTEFVDKDMV